MAIYDRFDGLVWHEQAADETSSSIEKEGQGDWLRLVKQFPPSFEAHRRTVSRSACWIRKSSQHRPSWLGSVWEAWIDPTSLDGPREVCF